MNSFSRAFAATVLIAASNVIMAEPAQRKQAIGLGLGVIAAALSGGVRRNGTTTTQEFPAPPQAKKREPR